MTYKIEISENAKFSILDIFNFLAVVDKKAAIKHKNQIFESIYSLAQFPYRHEFFDRESQIFKFVIANGKYIIFYKILDDKIVYIYDVLDSRKDNKIVDDLK